MWEGVDIYKICKPAACSFMKKVTHLQQFTYMYIFNCYLSAPRPTFGHYQGDSLTQPILIVCILRIRPEGHWEPRNELGSLSSVKHLVGFEAGTFRFWSECLNQLGHSFRRGNTVKVYILRNSLECLHMIFVRFFFSATTLQYKQLKIEFYFSKESYNEEQLTLLST